MNLLSEELAGDYSKWKLIEYSLSSFVHRSLGCAMSSYMHRLTHLLYYYPQLDGNYHWQKAIKSALVGCRSKYYVRTGSSVSALDSQRNYFYFICRKFVYISIIIVALLIFCCLENDDLLLQALSHPCMPFFLCCPERWTRMRQCKFKSELLISYSLLSILNQVWRIICVSLFLFFSNITTNLVTKNVLYNLMNACIHRTYVH